MKAMILAAGRGERMRPLTDTVPKPLLPIGGKPIIVWTIEKLARAGFLEMVINHAHLGHLIEQTLGDGSLFGVSITYSAETEALETAGGIANALPLLGNGPFLTVNGDIYCDFDFSSLKSRELGSSQAHLVLVSNPNHHPEGDFHLAGSLVHAEGLPRLTFSGIGMYRPELFASITPGSKAGLAPLLRAAMTRNAVTGEFAGGAWHDIGTPERLQQLDAALRLHPA